jgi:hypothetical protein
MEKAKGHSQQGVPFFFDRIVLLKKSKASFSLLSVLGMLCLDRFYDKAFDLAGLGVFTRCGSVRRFVEPNSRKQSWLEERNSLLIF